jgi:hypothetical protein
MWISCAELQIRKVHHALDKINYSDGLPLAKRVAIQAVLKDVIPEFGSVTS